jgi:uncharacterized linocin/CFP29 family protein
VNDLHRELAPISSDGWSTLDAEATRVLKANLAARRLVDFHGPLGWKCGAVNVGRLQPLPSGPKPGVEAALRIVQPLIELRTSFELSRAELAALGRGAADADLEPLVAAATRIAHAEDQVVFQGYGAGQIRGICQASPHAALPITESYDQYPGTVAEATRVLRAAGVEGPYAIALGSRCYAGLMQATARGGWPVMELVHKLLGGPSIWAPAIDGAVVLGTRPGFFELTVGQDLSIGYDSHDSATARLYLLESLTFRALLPEAAVALVYAGERSTKGGGSPAERSRRGRAGGL